MAPSPAADLERALGELYKARERAPGDPSVLRQIQAVRDQMTTAAIDRLRPLDRIAERVSAIAPEAPADAYLADLCAEGTAIDVLLDRSTLGRHRTALALESLVTRGIVALQPSDRRSVVPRLGLGARPTEGAVVVVADGNATQAALARTMTRAALHAIPSFASPRMHGAASGPEAVELVVKERASLLITAFQLPGCDAIEALRQVRARGRACAAVLLVDPLDAGFVQPKLPDGAAMLLRPFDKAALAAAVTSTFQPQGSRKG